jgi:hypothetical protein
MHALIFGTLAREKIHNAPVGNSAMRFAMYIQLAALLKSFPTSLRSALRPMTAAY